MKDYAIEIRDLNKMYKLYDKPIDRLKETLGFNKKVYHREFYALKNINLKIQKGEIIGIIGTNGSGKSTLLKIITGVLNSNSGSLSINGTVSALLELGAGFNPEYTGIENIYLNGTMMNKTKEQVDKEIEDIIKFADIGEFINQPVKTYSSGMFVRLAFAVATSVDPEILIVDEALSVGDINFQMKSINKIKDLIKNGTTVLFVSHDIITIKSLCNKVLYLNEGEIVKYGDSGEVCDLYLKNQNNISKLVEIEKVNSEIKEIRYYKKNIVMNNEFEEKARKLRQGTGKARVKNIVIEDEYSNEKLDFSYEDRIKINIYFQLEQNINSIVVAFYLRNRNQVEVVGTNNIYENLELKNLKNGESYVISYTLTNYLKEGDYGITVILADNIPSNEFYDKIDNIVIVKSYDRINQKRWALVGVPVDVTYKKI